MGAYLKETLAVKQLLTNGAISTAYVEKTLDNTSVRGFSCIRRTIMSGPWSRPALDEHPERAFMMQAMRVTAPPANMIRMRRSPGPSGAGSTVAARVRDRH